MINGLDGQRMLIALLIGIAILIILVLKTKVQAFLALIVTTVIVGIIGGMPLATEMIKVDGIREAVWYCKFHHNWIRRDPR